MTTLNINGIEDQAIKFVVADPTANTGKNYIDENHKNCSEDSAEFFDTCAAAEERVAQIDPNGEWAKIEETDAHLLWSEAELDGINLAAECPHCNLTDGYVSTGEHAPHGTDIVRCCRCKEVFKIEW